MNWRAFLGQRWQGRVSFHQLFWWDMFSVGTLVNAFFSLASLILLSQGASGGLWLALHLLVLPYNLFLVASIWRHRQASTLSRASAGVWLGATVLV